MCRFTLVFLICPCGHCRHKWCCAQMTCTGNSSCLSMTQYRRQDITNGLGQATLVFAGWDYSGPLISLLGTDSCSLREGTQPCHWVTRWSFGSHDTRMSPGILFLQAMMFAPNCRAHGLHKLRILKWFSRGGYLWSKVVRKSKQPSRKKTSL